MLGINLPLNLNLNFQSKFKLSLLWRLDGSCGPAAAAPRLRLPVSSGKYGPGSLSDGKGQAASSQPMRFGPWPDCHQLSLYLKFPSGKFKLTEVKAMLTLAFTGQVLAFKGPVLIKPIITRLNFEFFEFFVFFEILIFYYYFHFHLNFYIRCVAHLYTLLRIIAYYSIWWNSLNFHDFSYNSWLVQDIEPCILHLYTLELSTNRYLQALRNLCEKMQATTAFSAR